MRDPYSVSGWRGIYPLSHRLAAVGGAVFFVCLSFLIHHQALDLWFAFDDPHILEIIVFEEPFSFFWRPEVYQKLSVANFTPLLLASYSLDYYLFSFEPQWFYCHQLLVLGLVATGIFLLVRRWHGLVALWSALLFLLSGPVGITAHALMLRHYLEGALWSLISLLLVLSARAQQGKQWVLWISGVAYLAACLSKEVYVPLAIAVPFWVRGSWRDRLSATGPFWFALFVYVSWRFCMLENVGGYGQKWWLSWLDGDVVVGGWHGLLATLWSWPGASWPMYWLSLAHLGLFVAAVSLFLGKGKASSGLGVLVLAGGALGAVSPLWTEFQTGGIFKHRLALHIAVGMVVLWGFVLAGLDGRRIKAGRLRPLIAAAGICLMIFMLAFAGWNQKRLVDSALTGEIVPNALGNLFLFSEDSGKTLVRNQYQPSYWFSLARIRKLLRGDVPPTLCSLPFDLRERPETRYFTYSQSEGRFQDITTTFLLEKKAFLDKVSEQHPLTATIRSGHGRLQFSVGPENLPGEVHLLLGSKSNLYEDFPIPPLFVGQIATTSHRYYFRLARHLPNGQWVLSPEWRLSLDKKQTIDWANEAAARTHI